MRSKKAWPDYACPEAQSDRELVYSALGQVFFIPKIASVMIPRRHLSVLLFVPVWSLPAIDRSPWAAIGDIRRAGGHCKTAWTHKPYEFESASPISNGAVLAGYFAGTD
jgi:hypothetical protein